MKNYTHQLKIFKYVTNEQKFKYIIKELVIYKALIVGSILLFGLGILFGDLFERPYEFLINITIQLILLVAISIFQGLFSFEAFKGLWLQKSWNKSIKMKYIIGEGVIGFGLWCGVIVQDFYPFSDNFWLLFLIAIVIYSIAGLCFGTAMSLLWNKNDLDNIFEELGTEVKK